jgi:hypothetical protein
MRKAVDNSAAGSASSPWDARDGQPHLENASMRMLAPGCASTANDKANDSDDLPHMPLIAPLPSW